MKNDLTCPIVRDLLPSYIDGLTAPETNAAVEAHLAQCGHCAVLHRQMTAPEELAAEETKREVDYLKTLRRKSRLRVVLAILCTAALLVGGAAAKIFVIGSPAKSSAMAWEVTETDTGLRVQVMSAASANAWWGWKMEQEGEVLTITCREGLVSPIHPTAYGELDVTLSPGVTEVRLVDKVIWQEGTVIHRQTQRQWEVRTAYAGDPAALSNIANALDIRGLCGDFTNTLQTSREPYGWTLDFLDHSYIPIDREIRNREMEGLSVMILALVENLGEVSWTWEDDEGDLQRRTVTLKEVNAALPELYDRANAVNGTDWTAPESVKDCAASPAALQRLRTAVELQ